MTPRVTVVMATWNRGRHILPSVRAILAQTMPDFELLVIGDAVTDDTAHHLETVDDLRLRWINNPERSGVQSGPNNRGLDEARAPIIAYCGDDDIWCPNHLELLLAKYEACSELSAVSSGIVIHTPNPRSRVRIAGLFGDNAPFSPSVFTPPSAFSHRADKAPKLRWCTRDEVPPNQHYAVFFQSELARMGFAFGSTGQITVHKWQAVEQYLSRFEPTSSAQERVLAKFENGDWSLDQQWMVEVAREAGALNAEIASVEATHNSEETSDLARDEVRGMNVPQPLPLGAGVTIRQDNEPRGTDWYPMLAEDDGFRWCGPSLNPRLLLNVAGEDIAEISLDIAVRPDRDFPNLSVLLNGALSRHRVTWTSTSENRRCGVMHISGPMRPDRGSVIEFLLPEEISLDQGDRHDLAFAAGEIRIRPKSMVW
ncbi:MAG: glycosyltransferase family 2 protein [Pseudomonadota bacterium]